MIHPAAGIYKKWGRVFGGWGTAQHPECKGEAEPSGSRLGEFSLAPTKTGIAVGAQGQVCSWVDLALSAHRPATTKTGIAVGWLGRRTAQ